MSNASAPRHASRRRGALGVALPIGLAVTAIGALWALAETAAIPPVVPPVPAAALQLPPVDVEATIAADPCADADVVAAIDAEDDPAVIAAFGGAEAFRAAVAAGNAPCIALDDPERIWVVINKARPIDAGFTPAGLVEASVQTTTTADTLRAEPAEAIAHLASALSDAGVGSLGMNNGYRSYAQQRLTYKQHVTSGGRGAADEVSARPGFSEHQTGLALDLISCSDGCGGIHAFGGTAEGDWVEENAWRYGYIVRYESGRTPVTGYSPEPWHLRYIGTELAAAYEAGGYATLEEFFGLPAAPDYAG